MGNEKEDTIEALIDFQFEHLEKLRYNIKIILRQYYNQYTTKQLHSEYSVLEEEIKE